MTNKSDREIFRDLLIDHFAIKTAEELEQFSLPPVAQLDTYRRIAAPRADEVLRNFEKSMIVEAVRSSVISELKGDLTLRSRVARIVEVGLNISALIIGLLVTMSQYIFDPVKNKTEIATVYFVLLGVVVLQLIANLYLRYFDKA